MSEAIKTFLGTTGIAKLLEQENWWQYLVMYVIVGVLFYLAIVKKFEPLLLMPIAFGMLLANLPGANLIHLEYFFDEYYAAELAAGEHVSMLRVVQEVINNGGLLDILYLGVKSVIAPTPIKMREGYIPSLTPK